MATHPVTNSAAIRESNSGSRCSEEERKELLCQQLPQVRFIAAALHRRLPKHVCLEDLIQDGTIGLIDAAEKYDPAHQTNFKTYAQFRIRGAMLDSLRNADWGSRRLRSEKRRLVATEARLCRVQGVAPDESVLAREFGVSLSAFHALIRDIDNSHVRQLTNEESSPVDPGGPALWKDSLSQNRWAVFAKRSTG